MFYIGNEMGKKAIKNKPKPKLLNLSFNSPQSKKSKYYFEPKLKESKENSFLEEKKNQSYEFSNLSPPHSFFSSNNKINNNDSFSSDICHHLMDEKFKNFRKYSIKKGELEMFFIEGENQSIDKIEKTEIKTKFLDEENTFKTNVDIFDEFFKMYSFNYSDNEQ